MANNIGDIAATATLNIEPFEQNTRQLKTYLRGVDKSLQALETSFKGSGKSLGSMKTLYSQTGSALKDYQKVLAQQKEKYENLIKTTGDLSKATNDQKQDIAGAKAAMADTEAKIATLTNKYQNLAKEIARTKVETEGITGMINRQSDTLLKVGDRLTAVGSGMQAFGSAATKYVTAPLALGMGVVTKAAIDWESAFAGVKKTNDEVVDSNGNVTYSYKDLENGLRGLAKELPSSHKEIAEVAEAAGQLGIQTPNVVAFTKTMIDMGESTNLSAGQAATTFARFANITKMSQKDFDRLGAVVVELGNNFATTETEISEMGLRLAGAGTQIGMSQAQIMGFATALSSVGIEAEAGGSAFSKVMVQMQLATEKGMGSFDELIALGKQSGVSFEAMTKAVQDGGKNLKSTASQMGLTNKQLKSMYNEADKSAISLQQFAEVAGMTNAEFANMFKQDPSKAIMKFVQGLADAESQGKSAIAVLDDMDIKEVRLRDSLLRAANASGVFEDAIKMGTEAWKENTALTDEANKRYETTESKLKALKNEAYDAAIDLGGPFVDALRAGLEASKPIVKSLGELAKSFSELDKEQQQSILKWGAFAVAIGPATKVLGSVISVTGSASKGLGKMGKSIVELAAKSAEKKAIADVGVAIASVGTASASSTGGVTALTSGLGLLNPWVIGVTAAVGLGYGAWKLWGEEVWNSGQRTKRWGTDVGEATDEALTKVQGYVQNATGQFGLMSEGLDVNSGKMADNFTKIGASIEQNLITKIKGLDELLKQLPESFDATTQELVESEKIKAEAALKTVKQNSDQIMQIRGNASAQNRELSVFEASMIKDLAIDTTKAYVDTLDVSAKEKKQILNAMNGDVANASEKEATMWLQSIGKQRMAASEHMQASRKEKEEYLKELGYNLDGEFAQSFLKAWDEINQTTIEGFDSQMGIILEKYPELIDKVSLADGELISKHGELARAQKLTNADIMKSITSVADVISESSSKNAKELGMAADQATTAGRKWNSIVLDEKTGKVKTNAVDEVIKATESGDDWNNLAFNAKEANLESNAKLVLAEAALANGHWGRLEFMGKEALIESNATRTIIEATQNQGVWDKLSFEEKKALLYSDTPEKVAEAVFNMGLWDSLSPEIKKLKANNFELLNGIATSKIALTEYNNLSPELKLLIAEGPAKMTIEDTQKALLDYEEISPELKGLFADNQDVLGKIADAQKNLNAYNVFDTPDKILKGQNKDVVSKANTAKNTLNVYDRTNPVTKNLKANNTDVVNKSAQGTKAVKTYDGTNARTKSMRATDNASGPASTATQAVKNFSQQKDKTVTLTTVIKTITEKITKVFKHAKGTNHHPGGLAMINDQKGGLYKEYVELPSGHGFIPQSRDVLLDLPRGSKVLKASLTKQLFPHYAQGVAFENSGIAALASQLRTIQQDGQLTIQTGYNDEKMNKIIGLLEVIVKTMSTDGTEDVLVKMLNELKQSNRTNSQYDKRSIINEIEKALVRRF